MNLTINIETDESGTMTATVPEVPGLVVEADDVPTVLKAIAELYPLLKVQTPGGGGGGVYFSTRVYDGAVYLDSASAERNWMRAQSAALPW